MVKLSIIITNWNSGIYLKKCLDSIFKNKPYFSFEVILVDNDSSDISSETIKEYEEKIIVIRNKENFGLSKANNIGIKVSKGECILFLNPDIEILSNSINKMVDFFQKQHKIGALGPKLIYKEGSTQPSYHGFITLSHAFFEISSLDWCFPKNRFNKLILGKFLGSIFKNLFASYKEYNDPTKVNVIMGSCFLTSKDILDKIGYFDEHFFLYHEENELCYRLKKKGYDCIYYPSAKVVHYNKQSTKKIPEKVFIERCKSLYYFFKEHYKKKILLFKIVALIALKINIVICLVSNRKLIKSRITVLKYLLRN